MLNAENCYAERRGAIKYILIDSEILLYLYKVAFNLATWQLGHLVTWQPGHQATWQSGKLATWPPGDLVTWRPGVNFTNIL